MTRAVVRVPNWLGDSVMARPFVATLAAQYGYDHLVAVAHRRVAELWQAWPGLSVLTREDTGKRAQDVARAARLIRRHGPFDRGYLLTPSLSSALEFGLAGVRERCGFAGGARGWVLTEPVPRPARAGRHHDSQQFFRLLRRDALASHPVPPYRWSEACRQTVMRRLTQLGLSEGSYIVVAVGAVGAVKRYAPAKWREVLSLLGNHGPIVLVGTQAERPLADALGEGVTGVAHNWCGTTSLSELALLLESAAGFAGVDSGAAHLAASVACPTTVIFGPGDPVETAPLGPEVEVIRVPLWCSPCRSRRCLRTDHPSECLDMVPPRAVADAVLHHTDTRRRLGRA